MELEHITLSNRYTRDYNMKRNINKIKFIENTLLIRIGLSPFNLSYETLFKELLADSYSSICRETEGALFTIKC